MSFRNARFIYVLLLSSVCFGSLAVSATQESKETVVKTYANNMQIAQKMQGRIHYDIQRMYISEITDSLKKDLETVYRIPIEDRVYNMNDPIYMRSVVQMEWDVTLNGKKMAGTQCLKGSYTNFTNVNPAYEESMSETLRTLQSDEEIQTRFSIAPNGKATTNPILGFIIPPEIANWHYAPSLWYPTLSKIGFPEDLEFVEMNRSNITEPYGLIYTPTRFDPLLLSYISQVCKEPNLTKDDLKCILTIDPDTFSCKSFAVTVTIDGKQRTPFTILNVGTIKTKLGISFPSATLIIVSSFGKDSQGEEKTINNYFCQMNLKGFTIP